MGYSTTGAIAYLGHNSPFGPGTGTIRFDNLRCVGNEASLFDCDGTDCKSNVHA